RARCVSTAWRCETAGHRVCCFRGPDVAAWGPPGSMMIKILYLARSQGAAPELVERRGAAFNARLHARQSVAVTAVPAYSSAHVRDFLSGAESSGASGDAARISYADAGDGQGSRRQARRRFLLSVPR